MGETRHVHARLSTVLVMMAAALMTVVVESPARAAGGFPSQCVEQQDGDRMTVSRYSQAWVTDVDVTISWGYDTYSDEVSFVEGYPGTSFPDSGFVLTDPNGRLPTSLRSVTFDDDAQLGYFDSVPPGTDTVRVRPKEFIPDNAFSSPSAWHVRVGTRYGTTTYFTSTITWSDCDEDNDAWGDRTRDNCVGVHNIDQSDRDGDGRGDPCDPDDDNDGTADVTDNCPTVANADQTDWDGDRVGNACDSTPGTAPVAPTPTTGPTPTTSPTPITSPPGTTSGCTSGCAYVRTVGLRHVARKHRLVGKVESPAVGCRSEVPVTLWRKRSGADRKLKVVTTRPTGTFRTQAPVRAGRYYVSVGSAAEPLCGAGTSRVVRVRR